MIIKWLLKRYRNTLDLEPILQETDSRYENLYRKEITCLSSETLVESFSWPGFSYLPKEMEELDQMNSKNLSNPYSIILFQIEVKCT